MIGDITRVDKGFYVEIDPDLTKGQFMLEIVKLVGESEDMPPHEYYYEHTDHADYIGVKEL